MPAVVSTNEPELAANETDTAFQTLETVADLRGGLYPVVAEPERKVTQPRNDTARLLAAIAAQGLLNQDMKDTQAREAEIRSAAAFLRRKQPWYHQGPVLLLVGLGAVAAAGLLTVIAVLFFSKPG